MWYKLVENILKENRINCTKARTVKNKTKIYSDTEEDYRKVKAYINKNNIYKKVYYKE